MVATLTGGEHFLAQIIVESLCWTPETNIICVNYTSVKNNGTLGWLSG